MSRPSKVCADRAATYRAPGRAHLAPGLHAASGVEIARPATELDAGLVECIPAEKVFAEMRAKFGAYEPKV